MRGYPRLSSEKLRNFFLWLRSKEFLVFMFFLFVATFFWAMLAVKDLTSREITVTLQLVNKPQNVVVTSSENETLRVTVKDNGYALIGYNALNKETINVDFKHYSHNNDGKIVLSTSELTKLVKTKLKKSTEVLSVKPEKVEIAYSYGKYRMIPVAVKGEITADEKHLLTMVRVSPNKVKVYANSKQLKAIDSVRTQYVKISGVNDNVTKKVKLQSISGAVFSPQVVTVEVQASVLTSCQQEVKIETVNVPPGVVLRTFPGKVVVNYVSESSFQKMIDASDFHVVVDYKDITDSINQKLIPLRLVSVPKQARRPSLAFNEVDFLIEHP